jgi:hypothetical protein
MPPLAVHLGFCTSNLIRELQVVKKPFGDERLFAVIEQHYGKWSFSKLGSKATNYNFSGQAKTGGMRVPNQAGKIAETGILIE